MKKRNLGLTATIILLVGLIFASPIFSQDSNDFDQSYKSYTLTLERYRVAHDDYVLARSQFITFGTLTSQNNAKQATVTMLQVRDDVVIDYLTALRTRVEEISGIPDETKQGLFFRLDEELSWFRDHRGRISSAGSLDDLVKDSDEAKKRFEKIDPLLYETLSNISAGKVNKFRNRLNEIFTKIKNKVNSIKVEERPEYQFSTRKIEIIDRWVFETENRIIRSEEKQQEAEELIAGFEDGKKGITRYNKVLEVLNESQQFLKEASLFIKEIVREIKTAE